MLSSGERAHPTGNLHLQALGEIGVEEEGENPAAPVLVPG